MHTVHSVAQCERIMERGWKNRSVGYTLMNKDSSRSHSIFTISIEIYAVGTCSRRGGGGRGAWGGIPLLVAKTLHLSEPQGPQLTLGRMLTLLEGVLGPLLPG